MKPHGLGMQKRKRKKVGIAKKDFYPDDLGRRRGPVIQQKKKRRKRCYLYKLKIVLFYKQTRGLGTNTSFLVAKYD